MVLAAHTGLSVVARVDEQPDLFKVLRRELTRNTQSPADVLVVITAPESRNAADALCSRLLEEFSGLIVYAVHERGTTRFRASVEILELPASLGGLLADLESFSLGDPAVPEIVPFSPQELDID